MPSQVAIDVCTVMELAPALSEHFGTSRALTKGAPPIGPGVYVWSREDAVLYVGSAASLLRRLADYQRWIDGYDPDSSWQVSVVHMLRTQDATVQWVITGSHGDALTLERRLIEWHRACVGVAPIVTGWEAKTGSPRAYAERWARVLWLREH
jgi:hypothetical protein